MALGRHASNIIWYLYIIIIILSIGIGIGIICDSIRRFDSLSCIWVVTILVLADALEICENE